MQVFNKAISKKHKIKLLKAIPNEIIYCSGNPGVSKFADGHEMKIGCLGCQNKRCMQYNEEEIQVKEIENLSFDRNLSVCPVEAIHINELNQVTIDDNICIKCGCCMKRCPIGAIYFDGNKIVLNTDEINIVSCEPSDENIKKQAEQINVLTKLKRTGILIKESDDLLISIYEKLNHINNKYHDIIGRNLLISLGCKSGMRRIGDVYTRMDAIYKSYDNKIGSVEIEFGKETLDASRAVLEDIAVMNVRHSIKKDENDSLVVCLQLPNARQGYWQVIKDINSVEKIKIMTMSIGAMMLLVWNNEVLLPSIFEYYIDYNFKELRTILEKQLQRKINLTDKLLGILEPNK